MALGAPLRIATHLAVPVDGVATGTFITTGLVRDSGTMPAVARYPSLSHAGRLPLVVHGAETLAGAEGAIAISYDGVFRPVAPDVFSGQGAWRVTGGDHAYERLDASGGWAATARFSDGELTVDVIYDGRGRLA